MISARVNVFLLVAIFLVLALISYGQKSQASKKEDYKKISIDNQVWMAENLNVGNFRNGDPILQAKTDDEWARAGKEGKAAWCDYENKPENGTKYGKLYNWFAVNDQRGLAPEGWHVPTDAEWRQTTLFLGGEDAAARPAIRARRKLQCGHSDLIQAITGVAMLGALKSANKQSSACQQDDADGQRGKHCGAEYSERQSPAGLEYQ